MKIGVPKEILDQEYRVAITPAGVFSLVSHGHKIYIEKNAGLQSGITDEDYILNRSQIYDAAWYKAVEIWRFGRVYND